MPEEINPANLEIADELIAERRSADPGNLPDDMPPWMAATISRIDAMSLWVGRTVCWMLVPLCVAMVYEVIARKYFLAPTMWAYDISRMLYGAFFMLGAGYALSRGVHIRADFLYRNWSARTQGIIDTSLYVVFYFPGLLAFMLTSIDYAWVAVYRGERGNGHCVDALRRADQIGVAGGRPAAVDSGRVGIAQKYLCGAKKPVAGMIAALFDNVVNPAAGSHRAWS